MVLGRNAVWDLPISDEEAENPPSSEINSTTRCMSKVARMPLREAMATETQLFGSGFQAGQDTELDLMSAPPTHFPNGQLRTFTSEDQAFAWNRDWATAHGYHITRNTMSYASDGTPKNRHIICPYRRRRGIQHRSQKCGFHFRISRDPDTGLWHNAYIGDRGRDSGPAVAPFHTSHPALKPRGPQSCTATASQAPVARELENNVALKISSQTHDQDQNSLCISNSLLVTDNFCVEDTDDEPMDESSGEEAASHVAEQDTASTTPVVSHQAIQDSSSSALHSEDTLSLTRETSYPQTGSSEDLDELIARSLKHLMRRLEEQELELLNDERSKEARTRQATSTFSNLNVQVASLTAGIQTSQSRIRDLNEVNEALRKQLAGVAGVSAAEFRSAQERVQALEQELKSAKDDLQQLNIELNKIKSKPEEAKLLATDNEGLKNENTKLENKINQLLQELATSEDNIQKSRIRLATFKDDLELQTGRATDLQEKLEASSGEVENLELQIKQLTIKHKEEVIKLSTWGLNLTLDNADFGLQLAVDKGIKIGDTAALRTNLVGGKITGITVLRLLEENEIFARRFVQLPRDLTGRIASQNPEIITPGARPNEKGANSGQHGTPDSSTAQGKRSFLTLSLSEDGLSVVGERTNKRQACIDLTLDELGEQEERRRSGDWLGRKPEAEREISEMYDA